MVEINIRNLSARELSLARYRAAFMFVEATNALRAAGRGDERPSEIKAKSDPLSLAYVRGEKACQDIIDEKQRRMAHHGNMRPIKETA